MRRQRTRRETAAARTARGRATTTRGAASTSGTARYTLERRPTRPRTPARRAARIFLRPLLPATRRPSNPWTGGTRAAPRRPTTLAGRPAALTGRTARCGRPHRQRTPPFLCTRPSMRPTTPRRGALAAGRGRTGIWPAPPEAWRRGTAVTRRARSSATAADEPAGARQPTTASPELLAATTWLPAGRPRGGQAR